VSPWDPVSYAAAVVVLLAAALTATLVPARRAVRVDPMTALSIE
jgi:ABC-type lipoprotein release transport system permease subunit